MRQAGVIAAPGTRFDLSEMISSCHIANTRVPSAGRAQRITPAFHSPRVPPTLCPTAGSQASHLVLAMVRQAWPLGSWYGHVEAHSEAMMKSGPLPCNLEYTFRMRNVLQVSSDIRQAIFSWHTGALQQAFPRSTSRSCKEFCLTHVRRNLQYCHNRKYRPVAVFGRKAWRNHDQSSFLKVTSSYLLPCHQPESPQCFCVVLRCISRRLKSVHAYTVDR